MQDPLEKTPSMKGRGSDDSLMSNYYLVVSIDEHPCFSFLQRMLNWIGSLEDLIEFFQISPFGLDKADEQVQPCKSGPI